jgi:hypothetical protein
VSSCKKYKELGARASSIFRGSIHHYYLQLARSDRLNDADLSSHLLVLCTASADPWASWLAGSRMSERRRRAARCTRPASLCTAVVR